MMISKKGKFKNGLWPFFLFISDVHLGHARTPTWLIIRNLETYGIPFNRETAKLDVIFINGDFFDRMLDNASEDIILIRNWVARLIRFCKENNIKLRVLRGTRFHDWDQPILFVEENDNHEIGCDLKYITTVSIEYMEDLDLDILYVPDEAHTTSAETWNVVQALLDERRIDTVDYACMHGAFPYQLPPMAEQSVLHNPVKYENIVRHYISIGHVHQFNPIGKIIPQGSFDRMCHGDEGTKGHVRLENNEIVFVKNPGAMRYLTLDVTGYSADDVIDHVRDLLGNNQDVCRVRLRCDKDDVGARMSKRLSDIYRFCTFDPADINKSSKVEKKLPKEKRVGKLPSLTRESLINELTRELNEEHPQYAEPCIRILEGLI